MNLTGLFPLAFPPTPHNTPAPEHREGDGCKLIGSDGVLGGVPDCYPRSLAAHDTYFGEGA